ncbi:MAG TPA: sulfatase-like hydrolase/transferase, partial [Polyangiaceae bacterium]
MVLVVDFARRASRILSFESWYRATYAGALLESLLVWGMLLYAASRRRGAARHVAAVLFVVALTLAVGGQRYFHDQYGAYLNVDVSLFATNMMDSVINQLFADIGTYIIAKLPPLTVALLTVFVARRVIHPRRRRAFVAGIFAPLLLVGSFFVPTQHRHVQAALPDVLYLEAVGGLIRTQLGLTDQSRQLRPRARESLPVAFANPAGASRPSGPRPNVLFVILESVRADAVCIEPGPGCRRTPYSDALVPNRFPLTQMRSLDSCTAISLAVLWSGVGPQESREVLHTWPLLFDYAKATGYDTAFWTSQNMMFGNARLWVKNLGVTKFVSATDLDPQADLDMGAPEHFLAEHVTRHIGELKEPFLAVVQLSNVHYPYLVDRNGPLPFVPWTTSKASDEKEAFFNNYLNAVHQQDRHIATMIRAVREGPLSDHTVIVYTSDHGEAFREHGQMGHTFTVLDEEIHVPAWIDAPKGLLSSEAESNLRAARNAYRFHVDLPATILDVMGV